MKRCPVCGSISPDDEPACRVCGKNLTDVLIESAEEMQREQNAANRIEQIKEKQAIREMEKRRATWIIIELVSGLLSLILGIVLIGQYGSLYGLLVILLGMGLVAHAIALPFGRGRGYWRF